jgi:hypothetical protein
MSQGHWTYKDLFIKECRHKQEEMEKLIALSEKIPEKYFWNLYRSSPSDKVMPHAMNNLQCVITNKVVPVVDLYRQEYGDKDAKYVNDFVNDVYNSKKAELDLLCAQIEKLCELENLQ